MVVHLEANGLEARSGQSIDIDCSVATRPFSMSGSLESRFVFGFSFHRALALALVGVATQVVLHRVSIRTLGELV